MQLFNSTFFCNKFPLKVININYNEIEMEMEKKSVFTCLNDWVHGQMVLHICYVLVVPDAVGVGVLDYNHP